MIDEVKVEGLFKIEQILRKIYHNDKDWYLIKWIDLPEEESTWEPIENLQKALPLIKQFEDGLNLGTGADKRTNETDSLNNTKSIEKEKMQTRKKNTLKSNEDSMDMDEDDELNHSKYALNQSVRKSSRKLKKSTFKLDEIIKKPAKFEKSNFVSKLMNEEIVDNDPESEVSEENEDFIVKGDLKKDKLKRIIYGKNTLTGWILKVEWHKNSKGLKPLDSFCNLSDVRKKYPEQLCDFYRSRLFLALKNK